MPSLDPPSVSIIMPVYNAGALLDRAIKSVFAQTFRDFELVIVDDGSTDAATRRRLDGLRGQPNVRVHTQANRGPSHARNFAIADAHGHYICPLDADDWLHPRFLEKTAQALDTSPSHAIAHTWVRKVGDHTGVWRTGPFELPVLLARCTLHVTALYRRQVWMTVGGYDAQFKDGAEDWDFWISAASRGYTACELPETLAYYRRTPQSREHLARDPEVAARLMRTLVAKHRALYTQHLDTTLGDLFAERASVSRLLDRFYALPGIRWGVKAREILRQARLL
mgnify:CR=1 FL=1